MTIRIHTRRLAALAGLAVLVGGCANQNSIFRYNRVGDDRPLIVTEDAKQRNLLMVRERPNGQAWRVCAEASPDVFSALSTSAGADLGFGQGGAETQAKAKAAIAIAEAAGTVERTQTINMLRESMYRTCERYLSGGIDKATFVVQAGRDWRAMIAILAIEQLTRTARPPSTIIAAGSTTANVESASEAVRQLIAAQGAEEEARVDKKLADDAVAARCSPPAAESQSDCEAKQMAAADAAANLTLASEKRARWEAVAKTAGQVDRVAASTGAGPNSAGGGGGAFVDGSGANANDAIKHVATVVGKIVEGAFATDETQLFCLQALSSGSGFEASGELKTKCMNYLLEKVESDRRRLLGSAPVRDRINEAIPSVIEARSLTLAYLRGLTAEQFAQDVAVIRNSIPTFCRGLALAKCIANVEGGGLDGEDPQVVVRAIKERAAGRGQG